MYESYHEIHKSYIQMGKAIEVVQTYEETIKELFKECKNILVLGCGSNYWASLTIARSINNRTDKVARAAKATEIVMHPTEYDLFDDNPLIIALSRSGESKDLLEAIENMRKIYPNSKLISFTEYINSTLAKESDLEVNLEFANEVSVCQTRSFNALITASLVMISFLEENSNLLENLRDYLEKAPTFYLEIEEFAKEVVTKEMEIVTLGTGVQYGEVIEGAYIVMEMAQARTNYFHTLEYRHGPIVTANDKTVVFICQSTRENLELEIKMGNEAQQKGARVYSIGPSATPSLDGQLICENEASELVGLFFTTTLQSVSYHYALANDLNPDQPSDLVKYIVY